MSGHFKLIEDLRQQDCRLTPQREMVLEAIHESQGHVSAEEIYAKVQDRNPCVHISTVYRTLELLKQLHIVCEIDLGGGCICYELAGERRHHHLVCQQCGEVLELDDEVLTPLKDTLRQEYGFEAHLDHLAVFGCCRSCQKTCAAHPE
jgi:Fur family ferric uptake transcriptional regulator